MSSSSTTHVNVGYDQSSIITTQQVQAGPESREAFLTDQIQLGPTNTNNYPLNIDVSPTPTFPAAKISTPACFQTWFSPNVVINMSGDDAQISVCSPRKPGILATILYILEKHQLEVVSAHISSDQHRSMYMLNVHVSILLLSPTILGLLYLSRIYSCFYS